MPVLFTWLITDFKIFALVSPNGLASNIGVSHHLEQDPGPKMNKLCVIGLVPSVYIWPLVINSLGDAYMHK